MQTWKLLILKLKGKASVSMTFIGIWFCFFFFFSSARELLKLTLLEHDPEFIQTDVGIWDSSQDEKGSVLKYRKPCEPGISPSSRADLCFSTVEGWQPTHGQLSLSSSSTGSNLHSLSFLRIFHLMPGSSVAKAKRTCFGTHTSRFWSAKNLWQFEPKQFSCRFS